MNLLGNLFNADDIEIRNINSKYILFLLAIVILMIIMFLIKKNNYYVNTFTVIDGQIVLLVDKDYVNEVKNNNEITIDEVDYSYSIGSITPADDIYMISINIDTNINNVNSGGYKVYLGKEKLFEYITRIIKK